MVRAPRVLLVSIIALIALIAAGCGSTADPAVTGATTATTATTASTSTTTTTPTTTTSTDAPATTPTTQPAASTVTVYFSTGDGSDCGEVSPFSRPVEGDTPELLAALEALLAGPTDDEIAAGAGSFFSSETATALSQVDEFTPGLLVVGFGDLQALIPNASSSCGSEALLAQLNTTLLQFVPRVRYEMLESCPLFANWLQRDCMDYTAEGAQPAALTLEERASGSGCEEPTIGLPDGQWFGFIDSTESVAIGFDIACWFVGDAAIEAATEDGEESPPPNDYHVRNVTDLVITIPVAAGTMVSWLPDVGDPSTQTTVAFSEWAELRATRAVQLGVWLTLRDGQVIEIVEQFVP